MTLPVLSDLLNLSGPAFLLFYAAAFVAVLLLGRWMKRHLLATVAPLSGAGHRLSAYELASLAGGPERAIATALTRLSHQGLLAPATEGPAGFVVRQPLPAQAHELEKMLHREVELRRDSNPPSLFILSRIALHTGPLERLDAALRKGGWLVDPSNARVNGVRLLVTLLWLGLIALGVAKTGIGLSRDKPVGILMFFLLVTVLTGWFTRGLPRRTPRGDAFVNDLTRRNAALQTTLARGSQSQHNVSHEDLILAVALFGTPVLANGPLAWMLPPLSTGSAGSGGGDSGSSSSSCGGGGDSSCGGGGCGGCGGGCS